MYIESAFDLYVYTIRKNKENNLVIDKNQIRSRD